jgi:hypothetical protein
VGLVGVRPQRFLLVQAALQALQQGETPFVEEAPACCLSISHELLRGSRILPTIVSAFC